MEYNFKDCDKDQLGTGLPDCLAKLGYPTGFIRTDKNWSIGLEDVFDKAYWQEQIQKLNFVPFLGANDYTQDTPDETVKEYDNGIKLVIRNGKPEFAYEYSKTYNFHKIAYSHNSYRNGNVILTFDNGAIFLPIDVAKENLSGFTLGMLNTNTFQFKTGSEPAKTITKMQLVDESQFNQRGVIITQEELGFDVNNDIFGVIDCNIDEVGTTSAGNDLVVEVKAMANRAVDIEGLGSDDFDLIVNGSQAVITSVTENPSTGNYAITPDTAFTGADEVVLKLYDSQNSLPVAKNNDLLYKGQTKTITVQ